MKVVKTKHSEEVNNLENEIKNLKNKVCSFSPWKSTLDSSKPNRRFVLLQMQHDTSTFYNLKEEINQLKNTLSTNKVNILNDDTHINFI